MVVDKTDKLKIVVVVMVVRVFASTCTKALTGLRSGIRLQISPSSVFAVQCKIHSTLIPTYAESDPARAVRNTEELDRIMAFLVKAYQVDVWMHGVVPKYDTNDFMLFAQDKEDVEVTFKPPKGL